ncbi:hypothetical protein [Nocardia anaemiae]|nr:hypothetical protein [Nocardia anaemiae]
MTVRMRILLMVIETDGNGVVVPENARDRFVAVIGSAVDRPPRPCQEYFA